LPVVAVPAFPLVPVANVVTLADDVANVVGALSITTFLLVTADGGVDIGLVLVELAASAAIVAGALAITTFLLVVELLLVTVSAITTFLLVMGGDGVDVGLVLVDPLVCVHCRTLKSRPRISVKS
jgi:hypothetical protein